MKQGIATAPNGDVLLGVRGLNAWYDAAHILFGLDIDVHRGEVVALMGRNGAGKSTTLKSIMGLLRRYEGVVSFMGRRIDGMRPYRIARRGLGYVPEERRVFTDLTVRENLEVGRQGTRRWPGGEDARNWTPDDLYQLFPHLAALRDRRAAQMSGGEQQMLTIARTLMGNPYMILLDEPSEGVAPVIVDQMARMVRELKQRGVSILLSEQNLPFARLVSDRVYVLEQGEIRYTGSMQELVQDEAARRAYLEV